MAVFISDERAGRGADDPELDLERLSRLARHVLAVQRVPDGMELSVLCVDPDAIAELNRRHMDERGPTDVLAFPLDLPGETLPGEPAILGDVVLCPAVAASHAAETQRPPADELELLLVHGILHLLGYDHTEQPEREAMFALTEHLLGDFRERSR